MEPAPAVAGGLHSSSHILFPGPRQAVPQPVWAMAQRDAAVGSLLLAAGVTGAGVLPGPAAPVTSAAPVACLSASVPAPGVVTTAGAASATASPGQCERCRRSSGRERSCSGGKRGRGRSPSPAHSARLASVSASSSSESGLP